MAVESKDPTMIALCQPGEDAHAYMGASIRSLDYRELQDRVRAGDKEAKSIRQLGKVANLSLQYRTSAARLQQVAAVQYGIKLNDSEARHIHATYRQTYPMVPKYWQRQRSLIVASRTVSNLAGRRVNIYPYHRREPGSEWSYEQTAINYPIQSIGADQKFLALAVAHRHLPKFNARFYFELHDGLFFIVPTEHADEFGPYMKKLLSNLPYQAAWGFDPVVMFPVDGKCGPSWGELRDLT